MFVLPSSDGVDFDRSKALRFDGNMKIHGCIPTHYPHANANLNACKCWWQNRGPWAFNQVLSKRTNYVGKWWLDGYRVLNFKAPNPLTNGCMYQFCWMILIHWLAKNWQGSQLFVLPSCHVWIFLAITLTAKDWLFSRSQRFQMLLSLFLWSCVAIQFHIQFLDFLGSTKVVCWVLDSNLVVVGS